MPPPAKRRRGLAGSIVSTALSAALIGTAVGLTVYRLWRDRGKEPPRLEEQRQQLPPPPYQQGNWKPDQSLSTSSQIAPVTPTTPRRKRERPTVHSAGKRSFAQRRTRTRPPLHNQTSRPSTQFPPSQPEFNFSSEPAPDPMEVEDQMDWIGDKLSKLIEEGKRALNREVVVMSDSQEDEVDDGSGAWEEEDSHSLTHTHATAASPSRTNSTRRSTKRPRGLFPSFAPTPTVATSNATATTHHTSLPPSPSSSSFERFSSPRTLLPSPPHSFIPSQMGNLPKDLEAAFQSVFDYNLQAPLLHPASVCPKLTHPLTFYDSHLDRRLSLKRVTLAPTLLNDISKSVDIVLEKNSKDNISLPPAKSLPKPEQFEYFVDPVLPKDAKAIGHIYRVMISLAITRIVSTLILHPATATWSTVLQMVVKSSSRDQKYYSLAEDFFLQILEPYQPKSDRDNYMIDKNVWEALSDAKRKQLEEMRQRFPWMGIWQMFFICQEAQDALKDIDRLVVMESFPEIVPSTLLDHESFANISMDFSPDAINTAWGQTVSSWVGEPPPLKTVSLKKTPVILTSLRRSTRLMSSKLRGHGSRKARNPAKAVTSKSLVVEPYQMWPNVTVPYKKRDLSVVDEGMAISIIQHAWTRAVEKDSSFLILHCGTFERIAFRHRSSQTLFVSDLIDVAGCKNPAYGHIQIGLFLSIIEDVRDRTEQVSGEAEAKHTKFKRTSASLEHNKRPRTRQSIAAEDARILMFQRNFRAVCDGLADRNLALLRIQHGPYNSPTPSSFLRITEANTAYKANFKPDQYFHITLTSEIAYGATGDSHAATIEFLGSNNKPLSFDNVVVKLAFTDVQRKRLRHEFNIYNHMSSAVTRGIPHVFGLFEDIETEALALVMENVGSSLWDCRLPDKSKRLETTISESEKAGFSDVLKSIHNAGVRHRDLRLENLTINHEGLPYIIDFDRAALDADEDSRDREHKTFLAILDGEYESRLSRETQDSGESDGPCD
ncbi:hypothetical protein C0993_009636 [Termitomyces sp. T159_Od127]|nr:hypothetical protein C0993_009636 [Termitomyces sp. T159_Od127]